MGGGTEPSVPPDSEEDNPWAGFQFGDPWPRLAPNILGRVDDRAEFPTARLNTATIGHSATPTTYASRGRWSAELDVGENDSNAFQNGGVVAPFRRGRMNERENDVAVTPPAKRCCNTQEEEAREQHIHQSKVSVDQSMHSVAHSATLTPRRSSESLKPVEKKKFFKLMQIENDNQELSFVEKVMLSRDEIFRLCNDIMAGSAHSSEGRRIIAFGGLNSQRMTVVGFFGSKDVMREIFEDGTKFREQRDVWMQLQNDTLAPGLYAWLHESSLFLFYWHQGRSLPEATRKDMSCNFIRYIFDLCDTVCVCLEGRNLQNSLFESTPKFLKRRTQRLQISLVKESEDSVKVVDGFSLEGLTLGVGNALPAQRKSRKRPPLDVVSEHAYKFSEGQSRVALLVSSTRPRKLTPLKVKEEIDVSAFPAFVEKWTADGDYGLDLKNLSSLDFVAFIRAAKLKDASDYEDLLARNSAKKLEERNKSYTTDRLVETEQESLSRCVISFIDIFFQKKYPWEEDLRLMESSAAVAQPPSKAGLDELEKNIYDILLDKDSTKRLVLPGTAVYLFEPSSRTKESEGEHFILEGSNANMSKFVPISYGEKVTLRPAQNSSCPETTGTVHRFKSREEDGPLFTGEDIIIKVDDSRKILRMKLEPVAPTGGLIDWLHCLTAEMKFPRGWKHVALLTAISQKLAESERENDLTEVLAREALVSASPLELLRPILPKPVLQFARGKWEELRDMQGLQAQQTSAEMQQTAIGGRYKDLCVSMYGGLRSDFQSQILAQTRRFTGSLLIQKVRKQCQESCTRLEATCKSEEQSFLAARKESLSRTQDGTSFLTLTFEACRLIERAGWSTFLSGEHRRSVSVSYVKESFEKESIVWHGFELAPMKSDLDQLIIDNEHPFCPTCSASKEIIDIDPSKETLLKVVFLKAGQVLLFVIEDDDDAKVLVLYLCPKLGVKASGANCLRKIRRGFDLVAFDERSRFIALYDGSTSIIKTYRFDEAFRHMDWTGVDVSLSEYSIGRLTWMDFVTGKSELVFIDDRHRVLLCEVNQPGLVRSGNVHIGKAPIVKACVSTQGSCLLLLRSVSDVTAKQHIDNDTLPESIDLQSEGSDTGISLDSPRHSADRLPGEAFSEPADTGEQSLTLDVYKLGDSIQHFTSIPLNVTIEDQSALAVNLSAFASQMHLIIFDCELPSTIFSKVIKISLASEVCHLQQVTRPDEEACADKTAAAATPAGPVLDYVYQIFEKYATCPPLTEKSRELDIRVLLKGSSASHSSVSLSDKCLGYIRASLDRLKRDKGKDFSALTIRTSVDTSVRFQSFVALLWSMADGPRAAPSAGMADVQIGEWMRRLVCLVPIQIARAEHNALKPMIDGLQLSGNVDYVDAISLANVIQFGLYEAVFDGWTGPVKVISSMGKQSSGKSYLLNHLSGSLLDVAGGRCTDGVWMTLRQENGCLYVLLDFEGLGSFERSEQEDMLLSMLNAAISNLTIFNKKDFHLDKETEAIFERFQNGVSLVKTDPKLFRGLFYMAIKDVDIADVEDLKKEFFSKISQICSKSQDNFLTRMYGGSVEISAMPSFNRPEFHESIADIARTVEELEVNYVSGRSFLQDLKLVIAQISTKDWSPIDSKRVALRISLLRKHLPSVISVGCFFSNGVSRTLMQFDDHLDIPDEPLILDQIDFPFCDTALELTAFEERKATGDVLLGLMARFKSIVSRSGVEDEKWHSFFEKFISALVQRRKKRVLQWIEMNTADFANDGDVQKLHLEAVALLADVQHNLLLCSCKCERCFLKCVQEKGHPSSHSCTGDHKCAAMCTYCIDEDSPLGAGPCNDAAGHDGPHDCQQKSHTCGKCCTYAATSSNCNGNCSQKSGHAGDHRCNSRQHTCNQICSLPFCKNPCVSPIDLGSHEIHACHEKFCPVRCTMNGCNRTCATEDHFHGIRDSVTQHFCGSEHPCSAKCEFKGNCEVLTEVSKKSQTFTGRRGTFDYVLVSEQNGKRKDCCLVIPPFEDRHAGPHSHSSNPDAVHFCETVCQSCGYFCNRPMEHGGLHATTHGNMRDVKFVAESEEIDILDRKYAWGESGVAEMCQMHCKAQGRGHIHLIHCPANNPGGTCRKLFDDSMHEVRKYGPDFDVPKDEMTHSAFWEYMRFEDPCSAEEQKQFALCNHQCKAEEHNPGGGSTSSADQNISYCTESLWHKPIPKTDMAKFGTGYITEDGHHFSCDHSTNVAVNVIFVIDRSSSMAAGDIRPSMTMFSYRHNNRLGCVYEAILRFIRTRLSSVQEDTASVILFNHYANTVISLQEMKESLVHELLHHSPDGSTTYSSGLQNAEQVLLFATQDACLSRKSPVVIFLSDGGNNGGSDPLYHIRSMKALDPKLQLHTIMFGNDPSRKILEDMAKAGDGTFEVSLDEVQLSRRFEGLARSLRPQVASLL